MSEQLFRDFWWLIFPLVGLVVGAVGMLEDERGANAVINRARRELGAKQ